MFDSKHFGTEFVCILILMLTKRDVGKKFLIYKEFPLTNKRKCLHWKSSTPTGLVWYTNMAAFSLLWKSNMAAMTSRKNTVVSQVEPF